VREGKHVKRTIGLTLAAALLIGVGLGTTAQTPMTVLDIDPGVAGLGAGGAGLSVLNGAETLYYNPAGLADLPGISFSSFYASHFGLANYSAFALSLRSFGAAVLLLNSGSIQGYDSGGEPTETLAYGNTAFILGAGLKPSDLSFFPELGFGLSMGARARIITARIGDDRGSGFGFDLGVRSELSNMRFGPVSLSETSLAITLVNMFGALNYEDVQESLLMDIGLGASTVISGLVRAAVDLHLNGGLHLGFAYSPTPTFTLRVGAISRGGLSITAGLGVNVEGFLLDYAFMSHSLGGSHRISLTLDFSALDMRALANSLRRLLP
jgi:hypothetical protein